MSDPTPSVRPERLRLTPRRAAFIALVMLVVGLAVAGWGSSAPTRDPAANLPSGSDSAQVATLASQAPAGGSGSTTAIVVYSTAVAWQPHTLMQVQQSLRQAAGQQGLTVLPIGAGPTPELQASSDNSAALATVVLPPTDTAALATTVTTLREDLRQHAPAGVTVQVTGPAAVKADLASVFDGANLKLLVATALVVTLLLLITYRSPWLWLIPLSVVALADRAAAVLATRVLDGIGLVWDESTTGILSVLVFGAGTNYALLLISRYRELLRQRENRYQAMGVALRQTSHAVLFSASTVIVAVLMLALSQVPTLRALGVGCAVGILVAVLFALVMLPAVLVLFGRWVFWPMVPRISAQRSNAPTGVWARVARLVTRRPALVVAVSLGVLLAMSAGVFSVRSGLDPADRFLRQPESIAAAERIALSFPGGNANPLTVATTGPASQVAQRAASVPGVASATDSSSMAPLPDGWSSVQVITAAASDSDAALQTTRAVRDALHAQASQAGFTTYVGGSMAQTLDTDQASSRDRRLLLPLITLAVLVLMVVLLRSVVAPLFLVGGVLLTNAAALGTSWWVFTHVLGFPALDAQTALLAFLFMVALGVDYTIFLVVRALQEMRNHDCRPAMIRALAATGAVITSAGVLLAAVFAVLGVLPLVALAQIGVVICLGVLLDTLIVRTLLVPSLAQLLGRHFWWPRPVRG